MLSCKTFSGDVAILCISNAFEIFTCRFFTVHIAWLFTLRYRDNWAVYHLNRMVYLSLCVLNVRAMVIVLCSKRRGGILLSNEMLSFQSDQHHFQDSRVQGTNTLKAIGLIRNVCMAADNKIEQHFGYFNV